ncbi:hypothetical protein [Palleronia aestuarii]|nr:hypothetical protein [Palleronia aestuarii]
MRLPDLTGLRMPAMGVRARLNAVGVARGHIWPDPALEFDGISRRDA